MKFERTTTASLSLLVVLEGRRKAEWFRDESGHSILRETVTAADASETSKNNPPIHRHIHQTETFKIVQGTAGFSFDGKKISKKKGDSDVIIPKMIKHTFWNNDPNEDLVVDIKVDPDNEGFDERFLRNNYSYLNDCQRQNIKPSLFQLLLFLHSADILLGDPPVFVAKILNFIGGVVIGEWILGYKRSYAEYYQAKPKAD